MPELVEVENYRRLAERVVGRTIAKVDAPDEWFVKGGATPSILRRVLKGRTIVGTRRTGKLLMLDLDEGPPLGLRFGMSGRLLVDGEAGFDDYAFVSLRDEPAWDRFGLSFASPHDGSLVIRDPRRLGGVELAPDEASLGPDAASITLAELRTALQASKAPLKARLMDQRRVAGVGNLAADELLWRASLDPSRPAGGLRQGELRRLHKHVVGTLAYLQERGGSHTGDLMAHRRAGGACPRDGEALQRDTVGGRTTWWCPRHQS
ncbi:MAG TPA: DNA-formamidopyrimidine glycosylase family protein [Acidimicrobiales bacterium]|nr:DNA-formamidopyrimidine glycosylase family protein [Acidimicrobiales bacterium]